MGTLSLDEWERLYRAENPRIWRALVASYGDPEVAADAAAEAFVQAIGSATTIRDAASWIWKAAFKIAAGELQRRGTLDELKHQEVYEMADPELPRLIEALRQITPSQRTVVVLHDYADRPTEEISAILDMKLPTIHVHLSQGRKRLRDILGDTR